MTEKKIEGIVKGLYDLGNIGYKVTLQKYEKDKPIIQATQQIKELILEKIPKKLNVKMQSKFAEPINENYVEGYNQALSDMRKVVGEL